MQSEALEQRRLLSATLDGGVLLITGTSQSDLITVRVASGQVTINDNGQISSFERSAVSSLSADLLEGNDTLDAVGVGIPMTINAGAGDDSIVGGNAADQINSGEGNDTLWGGGGTDVFITSTGIARIYGGNADDTLISGSGADLFYGGRGSDTVDYSAHPTGIYVRWDTGANDGADGEGDNVALDVERIIGTAYADRIYGGPGSIEVMAGDGDDLVMAGKADSLLDGSNGNDRLGGRMGNDTLIGGEGDDRVDGGTGTDVFNGGAGLDTVSYATRSEALVLRISGVAESGIPGENDLIPLDIEILRGGSGNDRLVGSDGHETFYAMAGDDTIDGGWGNDTLWGGDGIDTGDYSSRDMLQQLRINEGTGIPGEFDIPHDDIEVLIGGSGNDWLQGDDGNDLLIGGPGDDTLIGLGGNDTLIGGEGADVLGYAFDGGPTSDAADAGDDVIYTFDMTGNDDGAADQIHDIVGSNTLYYSLTDPDDLLQSEARQRPQNG